MLPPPPLPPLAPRNNSCAAWIITILSVCGLIAGTILTVIGSNQVSDCSSDYSNSTTETYDTYNSCVNSAVGYIVSGSVSLLIGSVLACVSFCIWSSTACFRQPMPLMYTYATVAPTYVNQQGQVVQYAPNNGAYAPNGAYGAPQNQYVPGQNPYVYAGQPIYAAQQQQQQQQYQQPYQQQQQQPGSGYSSQQANQQQGQHYHALADAPEGTTAV